MGGRYGVEKVGMENGEDMAMGATPEWDLQVLV